MENVRLACFDLAVIYSLFSSLIQVGTIQDKSGKHRPEEGKLQ